MSPTHALLGLLANGERYGYSLKRTIDEEFAPFWRIDHAQLYRSLAKLTRAGWVTVRTEPGSGAPERKVYALTIQGMRIFKTWLSDPAGDRDEFFVKLLLGHATGAPVAHLVEAHRHRLGDERMARIEAYSKAIQTGDAGRLAAANAALHETDARFAELDLCDDLIANRHTAAGETDTCLRITGSDDPLLDYLTHVIHAANQSVGSIGGLLALAEHRTDAAGIHLLDSESGEYNVPFVKHLMPEDDVVLVNLASRENGLLLAPGNPLSIRCVRDLSRHGIRFINRQRGAGSRLLLYSRLRAAHVDAHALVGWEQTVATHAAVADAITSGKADAGPGLRAVAVAWGLDFLPLGEERFDLVIPSDQLDSARVQPVLEALHSSAFRRTAEALRGYDLTHTGQVVARVQ
jgi:molybdate-binding protein/DNA-binding PadR family transcriptional regulator